MKLIAFGILFLLIYFGTYAKTKSDTPALPTSLTHVEKILKMKGQYQNGVLVFQFPRNDLKIVNTNKKIPITSGFSSWAAWKPVGQEAIMIGNLVLAESEIVPFMSELARVNINITGLYNRTSKEIHCIAFMHVTAKGNADSLATKLRFALEKIITPDKTGIPFKASVISLNTNAINKISKTFTLHYWGSRKIRKLVESIAYNIDYLKDSY